jgi:hypothetical protein
MSFSLHLDSKFADQTFGENASVYYLSDPLVLPSDLYEWHLSIPTATIPLSYWVINEENNLLHLQFNAEDKFIALPVGNHTIDELVEYINPYLLDGYVVEYDTSVNRLVFITEENIEGLAPPLVIGNLTMCQKLLGLRENDAAVDGVLEGSNGVDLAGTSSIFIRSNLSTHNRDPVTRSQSNILAKVHITSNFNDIEYHTSTLRFPISDRTIGVIVLYLTDDEQNNLDLHNVDYSVTIEFTMKRKERIHHAVDYRKNRGVLINNSNHAPEKPANAEVH